MDFSKLRTVKDWPNWWPLRIYSDSWGSQSSTLDHPQLTSIDFPPAGQAEVATVDRAGPCSLYPTEEKFHYRAHIGTSRPQPPIHCRSGYFSGKLTPAEANYDVGNWELLSIKAALEEWPITNQSQEPQVPPQHPTSESASSPVGTILYEAPVCGHLSSQI